MQMLTLGLLLLLQIMKFVSDPGTRLSDILEIIAGELVSLQVGEELRDFTDLGSLGDEDGTHRDVAF